jgi:hypothetical protein
VLVCGGVPEGATAEIRDSIVSGRFDPLAAHPAALDSAREAFTAGLAQVCLLMTVLGFAAAIACVWLIRDGDREPVAERDVPAG